MITVMETTVWDVDYKQPNHKYILSDDGQFAYGYYKWGEGKPELFKRPTRMNWKGRKYVTLLKTKDVDSDKNTWKVTGSKGDIYKVALRDGDYTCTCPAATFRHQVCKHIQQIKNGEARS